MSMRKAQTHSVTRVKLLDAAEKLMRAKGYAATSVEEVCTAARLTKGCFFHYFESKEDLGKPLLERFCSQPSEQEGPKEEDPLERLYDAVDGAIEKSKKCVKGQGCLLGTLAQELSDTYPRIRAVCVQGFSRWARSFQRDLEEAKRRYTPHTSFDSHSVAEYFIAVVEGSQILAKAKQDPKVVEKSLLHFKVYLRMLFRRRSAQKK